MDATVWEAWRADDELAAVTDLIDDMLAAYPPPEADDDRGVEALRDLLVAQGLWSVGLPESAGGGGADLPVVAITLARLARSWPALALAAAHAHAVVIALGDAPAWRDMVVAIAGGAPVALVGAPDARVDVAAAVPGVVFVGTGTATVVPPEAVVHGQAFARCGLSGARSHDVRFDPRAGMAESADSAAARATLDLLIAAIACGLAQGAVDAAADYVATREQFGAPLISLPTVADAVFAARAALAAAFDRVLAVAVAPSPATASAALRTAFAAAVPAATSAIQLHGGYGYLREYPVERALRDLLSLQAAAA